RKGLPIETTKHNPFSIDQNVWGRAIETGFLEDIWNEPTKDVFSYTDDPAFPPVADEVVISFAEGVPVAIDGRAVSPLEAHQELERVTLEREQARFKRTVSDRWTDLVYDGQWFSPLKKSLDAFLSDTQRYVSGDIRLTLHGGRATVTGRRTESGLYDFNLATYDEGDTFDQGSARGFIDIYGLAAKQAAARDVAFGNGEDLDAAGQQA